MKNYRQLIHEDIRNLGIADNFLGEECLYLALDILKDNPMRLCCISKSMYFDMADAMDTTTICIERNLRTFIAKLWKTDNHRYLDKIAGRHLVSKPTNKAFLDMMRLYWCVQTMKAEGIGTAEFDFIHLVRHKPGITQAEIRETLKIDKGAAARRAASLEAKGYLVRKPNPEDKRSQLLFATEKAEELKNSKASIEDAFYDWLIADLSEADRREFCRILDILYWKSKEERRADFTHVSAWTNEKLSRVPSEEMTDQKIPDKEILNKELPPKKAPEKEPQEGELSHE